MIFDYLSKGGWRKAADRMAFSADLINLHAAQRFAEIGVWQGDYAAYVLKHCACVQDYWMVDPWRHLDGWNKPANVAESRFTEIFEMAMQATAFAASRRHVERKTTLEAMKVAQDGYFDAVYIDGDHTLRGITHDLVSVFSKVRDGGLILGDDLSPSIWQHPSKYEPSFVFPFAVHFAEAHGCPIWAGPFNQFVIVKDKEAGFSFTDLTGAYPETTVRAQLLMPPTRQ